ncbi:hypothetical protein GQ457_04G032250 [Hibiscus cannabinus]
MGLVSGILTGMILGISLMAAWAYMMSYRSTMRIAKAAYIKAFGALNRDDVEKICGDNYPHWISFPVFEQVEWLNKQLSKLWPCIAEATSAIMKESVEALLEEYRPPVVASIKFNRLSLGTVAPKIEGVRVQSLKKGQITMDIDFRWESDQSIILGVELPRSSTSIPVQLKDVQISTVIRVIFQLTEDLPCISAVGVSLLSEPKPIIDFSLKAEGSLTAIPGISDMIDQISKVVGSCTTIPGVSEMINQSLKVVESFKAVPGISYMIGNTMNVVDGSLTAIPGISNLVSTIATHVLQWPKRVVVPIGSKPVDTSELELKPEGKLTVNVIKAQDLEITKNPRPYAVAYIRPVFKFKTEVIKNNLDPVWNETFKLIAEDKDTQELTVEVFDQGFLLAERLGIAKFRLIELEPGTQKEVTLTHMLKDKDNKNVGSCTVKLLYHQFSKEEQLVAFEEERRMLKEAGVKRSMKRGDKITNILNNLEKMGLISGILMGLIFGISLMAGWRHMMRYRSTKRIAKAADIKVLGALNRDDLKKICGDNYPEWISFPVYEQVKWLNKQLSKLWPSVAEAASAVIKESVEPLLEQYRPVGITSLKFSKLSLGTVAPKIEGIRVQSLKKGQITMDIDFRWGGDPSIILGVEALVASIPIQLKDLQVFTVIRVIFQLAEEIPCISAVVVALLSEPKPRIEYTLKAVGGSLTAIPGISDMIEDTVKTIVQDMLQWPHRIVVPIGGIPLDTSELELKPEGKLTVTIVKANDLKNMEMIGKSDPYVVVHIRPLFKVKTKVIDNNLNPVWNQTFELIAEDRETQELIVEVFDKDIGQDKRLGIAKLRLIELEPEMPKEVTLHLLSSLDTLKVKDKKDRGNCTIKVLYHKFSKEEQVVALEEEKRILEERKKLKEAGVIGSTMDALDGAASLVGTGIGAGVGLVGSGVGAGVGIVGSGFGAVGSGLSKAGKFMGRTFTGHSSKRSGSSTPVNSVQENGGAKPRE